MNSDLISRSELKEVLRKRQWYIDDIEEFIYYIYWNDNILIYSII